MAKVSVGTGDAQKQWMDLHRRLKKAANGRYLQRELNRRIQAAGVKALASARAGALGVEVTSSGGGGRSSGLRQRVAAATTIKVLRSGVRINVVARRVDPTYGRALARHLNNTSGRPWVHPLFGNDESQHTQAGEQYFEPAIESHVNDFRKAVRTAMRDVADQITKG